MKKRLFSLLLCLVMVFSLVPVFSAPVLAADENGITNPAPAHDASGNLHLTKNLSLGTDGSSYDINMESWATGEVHTTSYQQQIPTDYVLVLDQSGSMAYNDMALTYNGPYSKNLEDAVGADNDVQANEQYYYKDGNNYYAVYAKRGYLYKYYSANTLWTKNIIDKLGASLSWFQNTTNLSEDAPNTYYYKSNGTYYPLSITVKGRFLNYAMKFTWNGSNTFDRTDKPDYIDALTRNRIHYDPNDSWGDHAWYNTVNGAVKLVNNHRDEYTFGQFAGINTGMYINYPLYLRKVGYTELCYRNSDGEEITLTPDNTSQKTAEFCNESGQATISETDGSGTGTRVTYSGLYTAATTETRLEALKKAAKRFVDTVAAQTDDYGAVDHRVAIVGFASQNGENTELLTGTDLTIGNDWSDAHNGINYNSITPTDYSKALLQVTDSAQRQKLYTAIESVDADGGTQPEYGFMMAKGVLDNRTGKQIELENGETVNRNTTVLFFTDGRPGDYAYSNQYEEANDVVEKSALIKTDPATANTKIYSIGVFNESDGNPLTYCGDNYVSTITADDDDTSTRAFQQYEFRKDFVRWYQYSNYRYYPLYRYWLSGDEYVSKYGDKANDTIADYMQVVSSNYPNASEYVDENWTASSTTNYKSMCSSVRGEQEDSNYYMMAGNTKSLENAFQTVANDVESTSTGATIGSDANFKDTVNLSDFDVTDASVSAKVIDVSSNTEDTELTSHLTTDDSSLKTDGIVTVTGFDYAGNYGVNGTSGKKLVVTISGLTPKKATGTLYSNDGKAGIYGPEEEEPTVSIESPSLEIPGSTNKSYVIDFNAPMTVATSVSKLGEITGTNGSFTRTGSDVTYKLKSINVAKGQSSNLTLSGVDTAMIYGVPAKEVGNAAWNKITTVPASSVYFDDDLTPTLEVGDGHGYASIQASSPESELEKGQYTFTFKGTGIDVYCTTVASTNGGYIQAKVDGANVKTMKNQADNERYNTPTISYRDLSAGEHTLVLNILSTSNYKLDGIRVYKSVDESYYTGDASNEANACYTNLRSLLVNDGASGFNYAEGSPTGGLLFVDNADKVTVEQAMTNEDGSPKIVDGKQVKERVFKTDYDGYKANSPKNEIYLAKGQGIAFTITGYSALSDSAKNNIYVGLSTPKNETANVKFSNTASAETTPISSGVDMYYRITPADISNDGDTATFVIINTSAPIVSLTNLKISGNNAAVSVVAGDGAIVMSNTDNAQPNAKPAMLRMMVSDKTLRTIAALEEETGATDEPGTTEEPSVTEEPEPTESPVVTENPGATEEPGETIKPVDPTPSPNPSTQKTVKQLIAKIVNNLLKGFSRLFGR